MILPLFLFVLIFGLWWVVLWLALPVNLESLTLPWLVSLHVAPPLALILSLVLAKRFWFWRAEKRKKQADEADAAGKRQTREKALAAHEQALKERRAYVECRGIWASLSTPGQWGEDFPSSCALLYEDEDEDEDSARDSTQDDAISRSLQRIFEVAVMQNEALAWLPVRVVSENEGEACQAAQDWQQVIKNCQSNGTYRVGSLPSSPDCQCLPGEGDVINRVLTLFEQDPFLPAILLLGFDSLLSETPEDGSDSGTEPGYIVLALLLARPGLTAEEAAPPPPPEEKESDPNLVPYWDRPAVRVDTPGAWGRIPAALQSGFLEELPALAALTRMRQVKATERPGIFMNHIQQAIEDVFIDAGLCNLPFSGEKDKQEGDAAQAAEDVPNKSVAPEIAWLVHNGNPNFVARIGGALSECRSDLNPLEKSTSVLDEHGNAGKAQSVLMQALAVTRATGLKKPVLLAKTCDKGGAALALVCPCKDNDPAAG